jgi:hypothetical protein
MFYQIIHITDVGGETITNPIHTTKVYNISDYINFIFNILISCVSYAICFLFIY